MSGLARSIADSLRARLASVRTLVRFSLAVRGGATLALAVIVLGLVSFGLDRTLRLAWETRACALVATLTVVLTLVYKRLGRPLSVELSDVELARRVEAVHPQLDWRLLSAVQFTDPSWQPGPETSRELATLVVEEAARAAEGVPFGEAVPLGPVGRAAGRGGAVLLAALALIVAFPGPALTWLQRNVLLDTSASWPRDTDLQLLSLTANGVEVDPLPDGSYNVPRGVDLTVVVRAGGVVPRRVYLEAEKEGADEERALDALPDGVFRTTLERVAKPFTFTVWGGDGEAGPFSISVLQRPWIERLELQVTPPAYTQLPARTFALESSSVSLPLGTRVELRARSSKTLRRAYLEEYEIGPPLDEQTAAVHTGTLADDGKGLTTGFTLERAGIFDLGVIDTDFLGLEEPTRFTVVAVADQTPQVRLRLRGVGLNVTPQATVGYEVESTDDYGLQDGRMRHKARTGEEEPLEGSQPLAFDAAGKGAGTLELEPLQLKPNMALTLWAEARDHDPRGPNVGESPALQLRIVTAEQLLNELLRRMHEQRLELERMISQEDQLTQGLAASDLEILARAPGTQRDVARSVSRSADVMDGIVDEMVANKILDKATWTRLRGQVAEPLRALHAGRLQEATELAEAAAEAPDEASKVLSMGLASEAARTVARELRTIVERMGRLEELAELISLLKKIVSEQRELMEEAKKKAQ